MVLAFLSCPHLPPRHLRMCRQCLAAPCAGAGPHGHRHRRALPAPHARLAGEDGPPHGGGPPRPPRARRRARARGGRRGRRGGEAQGLGCARAVGGGALPAARRGPGLAAVTDIPRQGPTGTMRDVAQYALWSKCPSAACAGQKFAEVWPQMVNIGPNWPGPAWRRLILRPRFRADRILPEVGQHWCEFDRCRSHLAPESTCVCHICASNICCPNSTEFPPTSTGQQVQWNGSHFETLLDQCSVSVCTVMRSNHALPLHRSTGLGREAHAAI